MPPGDTMVSPGRETLHPSGVQSLTGHGMAMLTRPRAPSAGRSAAATTRETHAHIMMSACC